MRKILFFLLIVVAFTYSAGGQNTTDFEIRVVQVPMSNPPIVAVEMQRVNGPLPTTGDFLLDLVFGIKWDINSTISLGTIDNTAGYGFIKSGMELPTSSGQDKVFCLFLQIGERDGMKL